MPDSNAVYFPALLLALTAGSAIFVGAALASQENIRLRWLGEEFQHGVTALAMLMTFCAGGILYLVFNDVAPQVPLKNYFLPPMGALLGFVIGMIGYKLTGA